MSANFPWGKVTAVHKIGTHTITEYVVDTGWDNAGDTEFSACGESFDSLDVALLASICNKAGYIDALPFVTRLLEMK